MHEYPQPVAQLITLGKTRIYEEKDYLALGLTREHIPDLLRLVQDDELRTLPWDENEQELPGVYAQVHAWRALTQLNAQEAIPVFISLFRLIDEDEDDFVGEEIPAMLGRLGAAAIEPCTAYMNDTSHSLFARLAAMRALREIAGQHPETRERCVQALASALEAYEEQDEVINSFLVVNLVELQAVEHLDLIKRAFEAGVVDLSVMGDFDDVQVALGLKKRRSPALDWPDASAARTPPPAPRQREKKEKTRRKQAKKARRQNHKRKKSKKKKRK